MKKKLKKNSQVFQLYTDVHQESTGFRSKFVVLALVVLIAAAAAAVGFIIRTQIVAKQYNSYIEAGNEYYSNGDYMSAVVEYKKALDTDERKTSSYVNLSLAYVALNDYDSALSILNQGLSLLDSELLEERKVYVTNLMTEGEEDTQLTEKDIEALSVNIQIENAAFDMVSDYTYTDYYRDYGKVEAEITKDTVSYRYDNVGIIASYYNQNGEKVLSSGDKEPVAGAKPCAVQFIRISGLLDSGEETYAVSKDTLISLFGMDTEFYQDESDQKFYMTAEYKNCKVTIETDEHGNIVSETAWNSLEPLNRTAFAEDSKGKVSGYVKDATTGLGIYTVMKVRTRNSYTGKIIDVLTSSPDGSFGYEGDGGKYTIEVSADGYTTEYYDMEIVNGQVKTGENIVLSPVMNQGEIRIILIWGAYPTDLDSYTEGRSSDGNSFSIHFRNKNAEDVGMLDVDDTTGYGPETTTIMDTGADFVFRVEDYNRTGEITKSNAVVKVYIGENTQPQTFTVPVFGNGNVWEVFRYQNGTITAVNTVSE